MIATIGVPEKEVEENVAYLNDLLADEYALYTKTRNAHWNVVEPNFYELHKLLELQYEKLDVMIDDIAERIRALAHFALGSLKDILCVTHLSEENHDFSNPKQIIQTLINDHESIIRIIRNDISTIAGKYKDIGTADFVSGLMEQHEKMSWMLRSNIKILIL